MTPDFRIEANSVDISAYLRDRLLSIKVVDQAGLKSDKLTITLDNRAEVVPLPPDKCEFKIWLGCHPPGTVPVYMGRYILDGYTVSNAPHVLAVNAHAADLVDDFKAPKTRSWHGKTIQQIVAAIAAEYGLEPRVNEEFAYYTVKHKDQNQESDAAFLSWLAEKYGAVAKPADGKLIFVPWGEGRMANGEEAPVVALKVSDVTTWKAVWGKRGQYASVTAFYHDHATGMPRAVKYKPESAETKSDKGPDYQLRPVWATESDALRHAQAHYEYLKMGSFSVELTLPGRPQLFAECPLLLTDGFRPELQGKWIIKSVTHTLDNKGYVCQVSAERKLLQEDEKKKDGEKEEKKEGEGKDGEKTEGEGEDAPDNEGGNQGGEQQGQQMDASQ